MRIWNDCDGGVFTTELMLVTSVLLSGITVGLTEFRNAINLELHDLASSVQRVNQSFAFASIQSPSAFTSGSGYADQPGTRHAATCITVRDFD